MRWKDAKGYEGVYQVSDQGDIKRVRASRGTNVGKILKPIANKKGYLKTRLTVNSKGKTILVHRIIAESFIPNPINLPQVNHINGVKSDNRVGNLEWCTNEDNIRHAFKNGLIKPAFLGKYGADHNRSIKVRLKNNNTGEVREFYGLNEAARELNTNTPALWRVRKGEYKHTKGWSFC